jgi:hypothetical protein
LVSLGLRAYAKVISHCIAHSNRYKKAMAHKIAVLGTLPGVVIPAATGA